MQTYRELIMELTCWLTCVHSGPTYSNWFSYANRIDSYWMWLESLDSGHLVPCPTRPGWKLSILAHSIQCLLVTSCWRATLKVPRWTWRIMIISFVWMYSSSNKGVREKHFIFRFSDSWPNLGVWTWFSYVNKMIIIICIYKKYMWLSLQSVSRSAR